MRCKSSPELATAREAKRKGGMATDCLEEAWSVIHGPTQKSDTKLRRQRRAGC